MIYIEQSAERKKLKREIERENLTRIEEAARTEADFENLVTQWNRLDKNHNRRKRYYETKLMYDNREMPIEEFEVTDGAVIPTPLEHTWWRQLLSGNFLDVIFDCPHELHELTSSRSVSELLQKLNENQKEVFYYRAIRQWSPQKIAAMREQSDRNIRKVYDTLIESLRKKLFKRLYPRYEANLPLTFAQREFVMKNIKKYGADKKKTALDGGSDK